MSNKTIKENIAALEALMEWFDQDDVEIEASISKYKEAKELASTIKKQLDEVEASITVLESQDTSS